MSSAHDDTVFYAVLNRLDQGEAPKSLADEYDISPSTVIRWRREFLAAKQAGTLAEAYNIDKLMLAAIGKELNAPSAIIEDGVVKLAKKLTGLAALDEDMQNTATYLNQQIKAMAMSAVHASELVDLVNSLCSLRNAFFNKNVTNVNIQNNNGIPGEGGRYSNFLGDKPNV